MKVYATFDVDGTGKIEPDELLEIGKARRSLGQSAGKWTEEKNDHLVNKIDANHDGIISASEFSEHFEQALPKEAKEFDVIISQFMEVAKAVRARKQGRRETWDKKVERTQMSRMKESSSTGVSKPDDKKAADDAKMREREEKAKKMALEKEAAAEAGVAGQKYRTEKAAAEAAAEEKRKKTAEHEAKQLARAELKIKSRSNTPERLRDDSTTAVSPQTDAKWREREEKARQKAAALAEERDTSVKGTTAVKSRRNSVTAEEAKALKKQPDDKQAADDAKMREREEKVKKKAAEEAKALEKEQEDKKKAAEDAKMCEREEKVQKKAAETNRRASPPRMSKQDRMAMEREVLADQSTRSRATFFPLPSFPS